ncbi:redox-sensing transcriptional repressor Rex [Faecalispora anaeroviscerum]|uniref:redox-sensing transcriptional repressor Rex n=1 Tax=Faecalispora anaeroviscerum TaxID=2991836 RepID=UPI0024B968F1|nr:redox-sensing transcriptional repressor Rex [Faecalispora anaeroviscerum]
MSKRENVSMSVIRRLPRYYRFLTHLKKMGMTRISSKELSEKMGLTASQIRQDLNCFGGFGQQGYGYIVDQLQREIGGILGLGNAYKAILIGAGNLGQALALHMSFTTQGFQLVGIFDNSPTKIGTEINGISVTDMHRLKEFCDAEQPAMAILCIPREGAEKLAEQLYDLGIRNFWNFSHYDITMKYPDTVVENVHLNDSLMTLCYRISDHQEEKELSDGTTV